MPAPKPIARHKKDGTFREDRHGARAAARYARGRPKKTSRVPESARWIWDLVVASHPDDDLSPLDAVTLEALCRWWARWNEFEARMGGGEENPKQEYINTMLAVAAWKQVEKLAMRFGLSILDRQRLKVVAAKPTEETDPLERLKLLGAKRGA